MDLSQSVLSSHAKLDSWDYGIFPLSDEYTYCVVRREKKLENGQESWWLISTNQLSHSDTRIL